MAYFRCTTGGSGKGNTLVVTCADDLAGATITCTNGTKTYRKTCPSTAPYEVTFYGLVAGTWTVSATVSGNTYTTTVVITDYEAELGGFNWKTWVDLSENYTSSDFTDLDDLLSDETAIRELMTIHACVDYLADIATTSADVETIIGNDLCAKWINLRDYALDTLYANTIIKALMDEADKYFYGEWALVGQVPNMTSNTAPYGEAFSSTDYSSRYVAYKAFDNDNSTRWNNAENHTLPDYVGYKFPSQICVKKAHIKLYRTTLSGVTYTYGKDIEIIARNTSNDEWTILESYTFTNTDGGEEVDISFDNTNEYREYAVKFKTSYVPAGNVSVYSLQFYAYAPKGNVPVMTSNSAPYGAVSASSVYSGNPAYYAFDGNDSTWWSDNAEVSGRTANVVYHFTNPICPKKVSFTLASPHLQAIADNYVIVGSNDGTNYTPLLTIPSANINTNEEYVANIENDTYYMYLGMQYLKKTNSTPNVRSLQFYGRELSVSVPTMTGNTTPYGEASAIGEYSATYQAFKAFNNVISSEMDCWLVNGESTSEKWIQYNFTKSVKLKMLRVLYAKESTWNYNFSNVSQIRIEGIKNGITTTIKTITNPTEQEYIDVESEQAYDALRYVVKGYTVNYAGGGVNYGVGVKLLQFYGFDYSEKEFEEGTTKKWLYDHGLELVEISQFATTNGLAEKLFNELHTRVSGAQNLYGVFYVDNFACDTYELMYVKNGSIGYSSSGNGDAIGSIGIADDIQAVTYPTYALAYNTITIPLTTKLSTLGISQISGNHKIYFGTGGYQSVTREMSITEWWLE